MGKWTPNYVDDVLHGKISNLVSGSIRRASVEKEPSTSYENFVHELDTGDSFTATIIDILVKEIADRRSRTAPGDRSLISDRTSRSLRRLANAGRTYPINGRFGIPRNPTNAATSASDSWMVDSPDMDDDEYEMIMQDPDPLESGRMSHANNVYEAFAPAPWPPSEALRRFPGPMSPPMPDWPAPHATTATLPRPWSGPATQVAGANLSRQASVRRANRTRLNDAMAERRRPYARDFVPPTRSAASETPTEPSEVATRSGVTVRRFFPRSRRNETTVVSPWPENGGAGGDASGSGDSDDQGPQFVVSLGNWHTDYADPVQALPDSEDPQPSRRISSPSTGQRTPLTRPSPIPFRTQPTTSHSPEVAARVPGDSFSPPSPAETERLLRAPRLPRSELSGLTVSNQATLDRFFGPHPPVTNSESPQNPTTAPPRQEAPIVPSPEEIVGYPTPGSTENENIS